MKKITILTFISFILIFGNIAYADKPSISAQSGILIETESGRILYSLNSHKKLPMASTTKIMTALLAIEYGKLDEKVKIRSKSVGIEGSSIYLYNGESISLRDLVYGLMLRSGNDAAVAIANHISGSVEEFANLMNKKAKEIGANNTNFVNPHGLHSDKHYTTAYDLALITREAMKYEEFRQISKAKQWIADREKNRLFYNKNKTLWQYEGGDGVKIGYTQAAGRCLVSSATRNGMQLIAVVINDGNWFQDCYNMFDYGFNTYLPMTIYTENQLVKTIQVINGKSDILPVLVEKSLILPLTEVETGNIDIIVKLPEKIKAPITEGEKVGNIEVYLDGKLLRTNNLIARNSIKPKSNFDRIFDYVYNLFDKGN